MHVYAIKAYGTYGGGMAIVAANNKDTAIKIASKISDTWNTRYDKPTDMILLPLFYGGTSPFLIEHYETGE